MEVTCSFDKYSLLINAASSGTASKIPVAKTSFVAPAAQLGMCLITFPLYFGVAFASKATSKIFANVQNTSALVTLCSGLNDLSG